MEYNSYAPPLKLLIICYFYTIAQQQFFPHTMSRKTAQSGAPYTQRCRLKSTFDQWEDEARARNVNELPAGAKMSSETAQKSLCYTHKCINCFKNNVVVML